MSINLDTHTLEMEKNKSTRTRWQGRHSQQQFPLVDNTLGLWIIVRGAMIGGRECGS